MKIMKGCDCALERNSIDSSCGCLVRVLSINISFSHRSRMESRSSSDRITSHNLTWRRAQNSDFNSADISVDFLLQYRLLSHSFQDYIFYNLTTICVYSRSSILVSFYCSVVLQWNRASDIPATNSRSTNISTITNQ